MNISKLISLTIIASSYLPSLGLASAINAQKISTPFWSSMVPNEFAMKIEMPNSKELEEICQEYRELVSTKTDINTFNARDVEILRSLSTDFRTSKFVSYFIVPKKYWTIDLTDLKIEDQSVQELPFYNQKATQVRVFENLPIVSKIESNEESLVSVSRKLGLKDSDVKFSQQGSDLIVKIYGKDLACDLFVGTSRIRVSSIASAYISVEQQLQLEAFYTDIEKTYHQKIERLPSLSRRYVSSGYYFGKIIDRLNMDIQNPNQSELILSLILERFFDDQMKPNSVWSNSDNILRLLVTGNTSFKANILIGL